MPPESGFRFCLLRQRKSPPELFCCRRGTSPSLSVPESAEYEPSSRRLRLPNIPDKSWRVRDRVLRSMLGRRWRSVDFRRDLFDSRPREKKPPASASGGFEREVERRLRKPGRGESMLSELAEDREGVREGGGDAN